MNRGVSGPALVPAGYVGISTCGRQAVVSHWAADAIAAILTKGTLHGWAAVQEPRQEMTGRGVSYGVNLPAGKDGQPDTQVVVRHNRHGGLLRHMTGDIFRLPTRAPLELEVSLKLKERGIPTPDVVAYAIYPVGVGCARCDVITRRLPDGNDFPEAWQAADALGRRHLLTSAARLVRELDDCGARHRDLNLKNIYISCSEEYPAYLLDVDRVEFGHPSAVAGRNLARFLRSARKWIGRWGLDMSESDLELLSHLVMEGV